MGFRLYIKSGFAMEASSSSSSSTKEHKCQGIHESGGNKGSAAVISTKDTLVLEFELTALHGAYVAGMARMAVEKIEQSKRLVATHAQAIATGSIGDNEMTNRRGMGGMFGENGEMNQRKLYNDGNDPEAAGSSFIGKVQRSTYAREGFLALDEMINAKEYLPIS